MAATIEPPKVANIVAPLLAALPPAALSAQPAPTILPLLSPILRQRVQLLSSASNDPWIRLLTYDISSVPDLTRIAQNGTLEPHPVSGEIEVDWEYDAKIQYRRLDPETLQSLVTLTQLGLFFLLVYCVNDQDGGGDGWRIGEVGVSNGSSTVSDFQGAGSISGAEAAFASSSKSSGGPNPGHVAAQPAYNAMNDDGGDEDDDDDYWARYDATPARTPAQKQSPAPSALRNVQASESYQAKDAEDEYFAQYDSVQPAMDNHDPDEEVEGLDPSPPLGLPQPPRPHEADQTGANETSGTWTFAESPPKSSSPRSKEYEEATAGLQHPRPESPASSNGSVTVAKLEETAEKRHQNEFGVKQHISRSIRSLFLLSRSSGIDRDEFEQMIKSELDVLAVVEDEI